MLRFKVSTPASTGPSFPTMHSKSPLHRRNPPPFHSTRKHGNLGAGGAQPASAHSASSAEYSSAS